MTRRDHTFVGRCAEPGCPAKEILAFSINREYQDHYRFRSEHPFRCLRHSYPDDVVSDSHPQRTVTYVVTLDRETKKFVHAGRPPVTRLGGLSDNYMVFASDLLVGCKVTVTVTVGDSVQLQPEIPPEIVERLARGERPLVWMAPSPVKSAA